MPELNTQSGTFVFDDEKEYHFVNAVVSLIGYIGLMSMAATLLLLCSSALAQYADRVKETTTTSGTGTINLDGAAAGFQGFVAAGLTGANIPYVIVDGNNWEIGVGTVTDAATDTLARDTIKASSNGGAAITLSGGTADVFNALSAWAFYDEDNMASDDPLGIASQQSTKAYAETQSRVNGLTYSAQTITTGAITVSANTLHDLDVDSIDADKDFVLTGSQGDVIEVRLSTDAPGPTSPFEVVIKTSGTDTIHGVDHSVTPWSKLFIKNEAVKFQKVSATNWVIPAGCDNRIPCKVTYTMTTAQTDLLDNTADLVDMDTVGLNDGNCAVTANHEIVTRRDATAWTFSATIQMNEPVTDGGSSYLEIRDNGGASTLLREARFSDGTSSGNMSGVNGVVSNVTDGDIFELWATVDVATGPGTVQTLSDRTRWAAFEAL